MRMTWLPRWRSLTHPAFWKTRTARSPRARAELPSTQEPQLLGPQLSVACHELREFRDTQQWPRGCYPGPRPPCVPGRCSQEWKGTPQRACRFRRAPASRAASYLDSTAPCLCASSAKRVNRLTTEDGSTMVAVNRENPAIQALLFFRFSADVTNRMISSRSRLLLIQLAGCNEMPKVTSPSQTSIPSTLPSNSFSRDPERLPAESARAFRASCLYLSLGPGEHARDISIKRYVPA